MANATQAPTMVQKTLPSVGDVEDNDGHLERRFNASFATTLALREKQIQQSYRPIIGIHKWFARRPGTVFRNLLLAEFGSSDLTNEYWVGHNFSGVIADPFMGGGTPIFEANRLGFSVVGTDINPMAHWIVRQSIGLLDLEHFASTAEEVIADVERQIHDLYITCCDNCGQSVAVKYFLWVKQETCPACRVDNDLFPGYLLAEATRHPKHVVACGQCGALNEYERQPSPEDPESCGDCGESVYVSGPARRGHIACKACDCDFSYPQKDLPAQPRHRLWALEYHCAACKPSHTGRFFKKPSEADLARFAQASYRLSDLDSWLTIPADEIPAGDETDRLHRWGYKAYRELFNDRQLLGLGLLLDRIRSVPDSSVRHALLTVFSDFLRYQNMLCRYDTYALKCQDIFSVHGFPVGLIQCENNVLGIPRVGSGGFRHFVEKYLRAKRYGQAPFETRHIGRRKEVVPIAGEKIEASFVTEFPHAQQRQAQLHAIPAADLALPPSSLDGVFTDPPYFDNVQYAELMDFCYVWLRIGLLGDRQEFTSPLTRNAQELTGNVTLGRGLEHFTDGLSAVFTNFAAALKPHAPFVFTYHHNDPSAYRPLIVSILDAGLDCTATLPAAAEMSASLHIARTGSSILDSVFVCREVAISTPKKPLDQVLMNDALAMKDGGVKVTLGDLRCLAAGHVARMAINQLRADWDRSLPVSERLTRASECVTTITIEEPVTVLAERTLSSL